MAVWIRRARQLTGTLVAIERADRQRSDWDMAIACCGASGTERLVALRHRCRRDERLERTCRRQRWKRSQSWSSEPKSMTRSRSIEMQRIPYERNQHDPRAALSCLESSSLRTAKQAKLRVKKSTSSILTREQGNGCDLGCSSAARPSRSKPGRQMDRSCTPVNLR